MNNSIAHIEFFGGQTPVQSWGTVLDKHFYFRARWKYWRFEVGEQDALPTVSDDDVKKLDLYIEEEYGSGPYDAGYMPVAESSAIIIDSICRYLQQRGLEDTTAIREDLATWFEHWKER